jgi:ribonuclease-3
MKATDAPNLGAFEKTIGVTFTNRAVLQEALTHRSYLNERTDWPLPHNERLEYLGDAVIELAVSEELFKKFPDSSEGQLTVLRAALVNYQMLSHVAVTIGLGDFILMSRGESKSKGKAREVILANAFEAVVGAIYLDQGFEIAFHFIHKFVFSHLDEVLKNKTYRDPKSELQEIVQEDLKITPTYRVLGETGPAHERTFRIGVYFGTSLIAEGAGSSKQEGEIVAARNALNKLIKSQG